MGILFDCSSIFAAIENVTFAISSCIMMLVNHHSCLRPTSLNVFKRHIARMDSVAMMHILDCSFANYSTSSIISCNHRLPVGISRRQEIITFQVSSCFHSITASIIISRIAIDNHAIGRAYAPGGVTNNCKHDMMFWRNFLLRRRSHGASYCSSVFMCANPWPNSNGRDGKR